MKVYKVYVIYLANAGYYSENFNNIGHIMYAKLYNNYEEAEIDIVNNVIKLIPSGNHFLEIKTIYKRVE